MKRMISFPVLIIAFLLLNSCTKGPKPVAAFTMDKNPVLAADTVAFTNQSTDVTTFSWDFGDDSVSTLESPTHVYQKAGTYQVILNVQGDGGKNSVSQSVTVSPSLTGYWTTTYTLYMSSFTGSMNLVQNSDNTVTGNYELMQGNGYSPLLTSSKINSQSVTIEISTQGYIYSIKGTVDADLDFITGSLFGDGEVLCNCYAIKKVKL
ncbi:MAG: PKD domain-containing protein [Bacteroidota bacterium]